MGEDPGTPGLLALLVMSGPFDLGTQGLLVLLGDDLGTPGLLEFLGEDFCIAQMSGVRREIAPGKNDADDDSAPPIFPSGQTPSP